MSKRAGPDVLDQVREQLAPKGVLRVALNMSNFLLVSTTNAAGEPDGVSPAMARAIANELDVAIEYVCYAGPGLIADAAHEERWDIANIAAEAKRAELITFSPAYCEIQASFLLPPDSPLTSLSNIDRPGIRIAVKARSAYDLWLTDNLQHAQLHRADSLDDSFTLFRDKQLDALAGLRPKLIEQQQLLPGSILLDDSFTAVQQSIGCKPGLEQAAAYLTDFVTRAVDTGLVESFIEFYNVKGKLAVASRS